MRKDFQHDEVGLKAYKQELFAFFNTNFKDK